MTKLNWEKDRRRRMPKDFCYDEPPRSMAYDPESYLRALDRKNLLHSNKNSGRPSNGIQDGGLFNSRTTSLGQRESTSPNTSAKYSDLDGLPVPWQTVISLARAAMQAQRRGASPSERLVIAKSRTRIAHMRRIDSAFANHAAVVKVMEELSMAMRLVAMH